MIIKSLNVRWFRSIVNETLDCTQLTALLGPNSCGKSSFLRALDLFYSPSPKYSSDDFYASDTTKDIEIEITFASLTVEEKERFGDYLEHEYLRVVRIFSSRDGRLADKCYGYRLQNEDFQDIRVLTKASEQKSLYEALLKKEKYSTLANWTRKDDAFANLVQWELEHPECCIRQRDNGEFFLLKSWQSW